MVVGGWQWKDDMMSANINFKISQAKKTIEKLTMGVVSCPLSFSGFRLKPLEDGGGDQLMEGGAMAEDGRSGGVIPN